MTVLAVRNRLGGTVVDCILSDFDSHGPQAVQTLREQDPQGYARTLCDLVAVRDEIRASAGDTVKRASSRAARSRRSRGAQILLAALEADFALHGAETIAILRETRPQAWARLLAEVCQFKLVPKTPKGPPRRPPRPLRMKTLITEMSVPPKIDLDSPVLPAEQQEMMLKAVEEVGAEQLAAMELAELLEHLPDALALWTWRWFGAGRDGRSAPHRASTSAGDWRDAFRAADQPAGVKGKGFTMR